MKMNHKMNKIQIQELECLIVEHLTIIDEEQLCMGEVKLDNKCKKIATDENASSSIHQLTLS